MRQVPRADPQAGIGAPLRTQLGFRSLAEIVQAKEGAAGQLRACTVISEGP
jgi:hypothetical protein